MNAVLFYFFGTFPLGNYLRSNQNLSSGYQTLENATRNSISTIGQGYSNIVQGLRTRGANGDEESSR
jgi:hypothetical protein